MDYSEYILSFFRDFLVILSEMAPYLLLGFFFAGLLHAFVPKQKIDKYFNGSPLRASIRSSLFGVPLPLCSCGVIPTGIALYKNGASKGGTISFLISTPQTGIDSILATFSLMGLPFAIIRPVAALITGITGGLITSKVTKAEMVKPLELSEEEAEKTFAAKVKDVVKYGFVEFIQDISKWLVIGLVLAAIISAVIPDNFMVLTKMNPLMQMGLILVVSIPLYICATGSIPLAAILILKGISPGAAFVLLMAGPATNAATITMIGKTMGKKSLLAYLSTIIVGALAFGLLIDYVLPFQWFSQMSSQLQAAAHGESLSWWKIASAIVLMLLIVNGYIQQYLRSKKKSIANESNEEITLVVGGISCNHCKSNVETHLKKLPYIDKVVVNVSENTVTIQGDQINLNQTKELLTTLGYDPE